MTIQSTLSTRNLSIYAITTSFLLNYIPHVYKFGIITLKGGKWDNKDPRANADKAASKLNQHELAIKLRRAAAAEQNGHEIFPLFAAAVIAANLARVPTYTLNKWSAIFLALRVIYNPLYILAGSNDMIAAARSVTWNAGLFACLRLLTLAARNASKTVENVLVVVT